jgi:hypothetical protein
VFTAELGVSTVAGAIALTRIPLPPEMARAAPGTTFILPFGWPENLQFQLQKIRDLGLAEEQERLVLGGTMAKLLGLREEHPPVSGRRA